MDIGQTREEEMDDGESLIVSRESFRIWMRFAERHRAAETYGFDMGQRLLALCQSAGDPDDELCRGPCAKQFAAFRDTSGVRGGCERTGTTLSRLARNATFAFPLIFGHLKSSGCVLILETPVWVTGASESMNISIIVLVL